MILFYKQLLSLWGGASASLFSWIQQFTASAPWVQGSISDLCFWLTGEGVPLSPAKLNGSDSSKSLPSPSSSPQPNWIASPTHDPQWYPSDSTDSSLSSLFGECFWRTLLSKVGVRLDLSTFACFSSIYF